eukprot:s716_g10.t1
MPSPVIWEIVGGGDKGGIIVRDGESTKSAQLGDRLSTGSLVEQVTVKGAAAVGSGTKQGVLFLKISGAFTSLLIMVLDLCPEFYIGGKEDLIWLPANEEHQRRCWLAPKPDVAADPVSEKMPKAVQAGLATTVAPAALSLRYAQTSPRQELSRTYATTRIAGYPGYTGTVPKSAVTVAKPGSSLLDRRPPEGWISVLLSGKPLAVVARGEAGAPAPSKDEASATTEPVWDNFPRAGDGGRPTSLGAFKKVVGEAATGEFWGLNFPLSADQFLEMGPDWLTKAMHKAGTLPTDNRIVKFTDFDIKAAKTTESTESTEASWGGAGIKILLSVDYSREPVGDEPGKEMFVKMPHEFTGKNERFKISVTINGDWAETMFYNMLSGKLPVKTPRIFFADMNRRTTMPRRKAFFEDACEMYYAHSRALARFFGWFYHTNQTTSQVAECFAQPEALKTMHELFARVRPLNQKARDAFYVK